MSQNKNMIGEHHILPFKTTNIIMWSIDNKLNQL
jgi:hypothetical protein